MQIRPIIELRMRKNFIADRTHAPPLLRAWQQRWPLVVASSPVVFMRALSLSHVEEEVTYLGVFLNLEKTRDRPFVIPVACQSLLEERPRRRQHHQSGLPLEESAQRSTF